MLFQHSVFEQSHLKFITSSAIQEQGHLKDFVSKFLCFKAVTSLRINSTQSKNQDQTKQETLWRLARTPDWYSSQKTRNCSNSNGHTQYVD